MHGPVFLDTETTGLDGPPLGGLVQVGVVDSRGRVLLDCLVNCGLAISPQASAVHGMTEADVAGALDHFTVRRLVHQLIECRDVVIYNRAFDAMFLDLTSANAVMCAMQTAQDYWNTERAPRLAWCAEQIGIAQPEPHSAVTDADVCRQVWQYMHRDQP